MDRLEFTPHKAGDSAPEVTTSKAAQWWQFLLLGVGVGLAVLSLHFLVERFLVEPLACRSADAFSACSNAGAMSFNIATVLAAVIGTIGLVKLAAYRPLLIAIVAAVTLWNLQGLLGGLAWQEVVGWVSALYAICYSLFSKILRIDSLPIALIATIVVVVAARIVLSA